MEKPVHNIIIVMVGPNGRPLMQNMTIPEPGAARLMARLSTFGPGSNSQEVKSALIQGFAEIDFVKVNEPTERIVEVGRPPPPDGLPLTQVYRHELLALANGELRVDINELGDPVLVEVGAGDGPDLDFTEPVAGGEHLDDDDPATNGSASGEKHTE